MTSPLVLSLILTTNIKVCYQSSSTSLQILTAKSAKQENCFCFQQKGLEIATG